MDQDPHMKAWCEAVRLVKVDPVRDALYSYDNAAQNVLVNHTKPWTGDLHYFKSVRISAIALTKMVMHARSGGSIEVMGLMQGYMDRSALVVTDAFRLPVVGTETRVNAQEEANEYLVEYLKLCRDQGRLENVIGWYHSHPGYGCWLSGIDVGTQSMQQQFGDPFVAVVIDPEKTVSAGKVEIGAFRTYPETYKPLEAGHGAAVAADGFQQVPLSKADDFGAHSSRYYSLTIEHYKSALDAHLLDLLWNKYWVQTLSQNPLLASREYDTSQMVDLAYKIKDVTATLERTNRISASGVGMAGSGVGSSAFGLAGSGGPSKKLFAKAVNKVDRAGKQLASREQAGLISIKTRAKVFSLESHGAENKDGAASAAAAVPASTVQAETEEAKQEEDEEL